MKVILHFGSPKTATTTIQHTLWAQKQALLTRGICYPGNFVRHHELARALAQAEAGKARWEAAAGRIVAEFAEEASRVGAETLLISSEFFFAASPSSSRRLLDMLERHLPEIESLRLVVYVREPIGFAASLGQQSLKAGRIRLSELYENPHRLRIGQALANHAEVFGRQNMVLRVFERDRLRDGDIIADFLDACGVGDLALAKSTPVLNSALSWEGIQIADALALLRPFAKRQRNKRTAYKRQLEAIGGSKFALPAEVQERVVEQSREDIAELREAFGLDLLPQRVPAPEVVWMPEDTAMSVARLIERLVEKG